MKLSLAKKWKRKRQVKQKLKLTVTNKFRKSKRELNRKFQGKFFLLLSKVNKKCGAILHFVNSKECTAKWAIPVTKAIKRQTSRKFIITPKRSRRELRNIEVIVTNKFKENFLKLWTKTYSDARINKDKKVNNDEKKVTAIKILSCKLCNHKFTSRKFFDQHIATAHVDTIDLDSSSGSEKDMVIDDDVELVLDDDLQCSTQHPENFLNLKQEPNVDEEFCCIAESCGKVFNTEEALIVHIGIQHDFENKRFTCSKCNESFARESALIGHQRIFHPVEIIEPLPLLDPAKPRQKPHYFTMSPPPSTVQTPKSSGGTKTTIKFKRFDLKDQFVCRICSALFEQRLHLDRHITVHHIAKVYFCYKCHHPYIKLHLLHHLKTAHIKSVNDTGYIQTISNFETVASHRCAFCKFTSKERNRVDQHMSSEHYDEFEKSDSNEEEDDQEHASSPDSLEHLFKAESTKVLSYRDLEDEDLLVEVSKRKNDNTRKRKPPNDPTFKHRCARCQRRFSRKDNLRSHACTGVKIPPKPQSSAAPVKIAPISVLNGFHKCPVCPQFFTDEAMCKKHAAQHTATKIASSTGFTSGYIS